jgi:hypothetical protein
MMRLRRKKEAPPPMPKPGEWRFKIRQEALDTALAALGHVPAPPQSDDAEPETFTISAVAAEQCIEAMHQRQH